MSTVIVKLPVATPCNSLPPSAFTVNASGAVALALKLTLPVLLLVSVVGATIVGPNNALPIVLLVNVNCGSNSPPPLVMLLVPALVTVKSVCMPGLHLF